MSSLKEIPFCDVYYPTKEEFNDFEKYIEVISNSTNSGLVKVKKPLIKRLFPQKVGWQEATITKI